MKKHYVLIIILVALVVVSIAAYVVYGSIETAFTTWKNNFISSNPFIAGLLGLTPNNTASSDSGENNNQFVGTQDPDGNY